MIERKRSEVVSVQHLRGIGAMLVVLFHASAKIGWLYNPLPDLYFGAGGVDIFFVISGFVMYVAARHEGPGEFWYKRIIRIVPLYWLVTIAFFGMRHAHYGEPGVDLASLAKSLLFVPYRVGGPGAPVYPFLVPGWSLNVEMFFYLLFGIGLAIGRPARFSGVMIGLAVLAGLLFTPTLPAAELFSKPIMLEFVFGLWLGDLWASGRFPRRLWPIAMIGWAVFLVSDAFGAAAYPMRGIAAMAIMLGTISIEATREVRHHPLLKLLGDASYSIYLVHTPVLQVLRPVFARIPIGGWPQLVLFILTALVVSAMAGYLVHRFAERPLLRLLRRRPARGAENESASPAEATA